MQQKKFKRYEAAFDSLIGRELVLSYTDAVELTDETHAAAQKQSYIKLKEKVIGIVLPSSLELAGSLPVNRLKTWPQSTTT